MRNPLPGWLLALMLLGGPLWAVSVAEAAEPSAPQATGIVKIKSPQPGTQVWIDHELVGEAPIIKYLPVGPHTVRLAVDGFDPYVRKVEVAANETREVNATFTAGGGTIEFVVEPPGGKLILDGKESWPLPVRIPAPAEGKHTWRLEAPNAEPLEGELTFARGKNLFFHHKLTSSAGRFSVRSTPEGASVRLDGAAVGQTPLDLQGIAQGKHTVLVEKEGYATAIRSVDTSGGAKGVVEAPLQKGGAALIIKTGDPAAQIFLGGALIGTGEELSFAAVEKGRYAIEVTAPGKKPARITASVPSAGRVSYRAELVAEGDGGRSALVAAKPLFQRWTFWTAVGAGGVGLAAGGVLIAKQTETIPVPSGDVVVSLP